jgi:hypothetical protein
VSRGAGLTGVRSEDDGAWIPALLDDTPDDEQTRSNLESLRKVSTIFQDIARMWIGPDGRAIS